MERRLGHNNFYFRPAAKGDTSIITKNDDDFNAALEFVKSSIIEGHTYTLKSENRHNIILRNLCPSFDEVDISQGIKAMNLDVQVANITKYSTPTSRNNGEDLNLSLIQLEPGSDVRALLAQRCLLQLRGIRFEFQKKQGIAQCRNCQQYGHSAINSFRKYQCVKCTEDHAYGECIKRPQIDQVACANCKANQPANYRGCQAHQDLLKRIEAKK